MSSSRTIHTVFWLVHSTFFVWFWSTAPITLAWMSPLSSSPTNAKKKTFAREKHLSSRATDDGGDKIEDLLASERNIIRSLQTNQGGTTDYRRREMMGTIAAAATTGILFPSPPSFAEDEPTTAMLPVELTPASPDAKKLFNEGRALESQGNMIAAQRLYSKVTKISPRFVYGWSNLGNTQVALGDLVEADENYSKAIGLCQESAREASSQGFGVKKCNDLYVLLLNRGSVRLNTPGRKEEALSDLRQSNTLRERPDAVILQNLARAEELNGLYSMADKNYNLAISMTANEVNPFWLRSAMVKLQIGDLKGGRDLLKRVENRFPDAPEVKAASATFLWATGRQSQTPSSLDITGVLGTTAASKPAEAKSQQPLPEDYQIDAQRKFLEIPDKQRLRFIDSKYLEETIAWPPTMIEGVTSIARAVGDFNRVGSSN